METKRTRQPQSHATDFYLLFTQKLKSKGITLEHVLQFEGKPQFTKRDIAQKFEQYVQTDEHLYRVDKQGKKVALSRRYIFEQFARHYALQVMQALGLEVKPSAQMRARSKVERLVQFVQPSLQELDEPISL